MKKLKFYFFLTLVCLLSVLFLSSYLVAEESHVMVCKGGGKDIEFRYFLKKNIIQIIFSHSAKSATAQEPTPGTCAWVDRPLKQSEPHQLIIENLPEYPFNLIGFQDGKYFINSPIGNFKYLYEAFSNSQKFYVHCYRDGSTFKVTKVGP